MGRKKLRALLAQEGVFLSAKSIDRVIRRLKARGVLWEATQPRRVFHAQMRRQRRPKELVVDGRRGRLSWSRIDSIQTELIAAVNGLKHQTEVGALVYTERLLTVVN